MLNVGCYFPLRAIVYQFTLLTSWQALETKICRKCRLPLQEPSCVALNDN